MNIDYTDCYIDTYDFFYDALYCFIIDSNSYEIIELLPI